MVEQTFSIDRMEQAVSLFGSFDENIKLIEKEFQVRVICRGSELKIQGDEENVDKTKRAIKNLLTLINKVYHLICLKSRISNRWETGGRFEELNSPAAS